MRDRGPHCSGHAEPGWLPAATALASFPGVTMWQMRFDEGVMPVAGAAAQAANPPGLASSACSSTSAADLDLELPGAIIKNITAAPLLPACPRSVRPVCYQYTLAERQKIIHPSIVWGRCQGTCLQQRQVCSVKTCTAWLQAWRAAVLVHCRPGRRLLRCWPPCSTWPASKAS